VSTRERPAPVKGTGPDTQQTPTARSQEQYTPRGFLPCGCQLLGACVHRDPDAPRLTEPAEDGPRCAGTDRHACGKYTTQQLAAIGRRGVCCAELDPREGAS
jgi:hypothetical protein